MISVIHVGPGMYSFGGTQTVIRVIRDHKMGADDIRVLSTWEGRHHAKNAVLTARAAAELARVPRTSIVHFHVADGGAWLREGALIRLARARGLRVVLTLQGSDFVGDVARHRRYIGATLRCADHAIVFSEGAQEAVASVAPKVKTTLSVNPSPIDWDAPGASTTKPVALFAGTIGLRKGVDTLAAAWQLLLDEGIEGECRVVGPIADYTPPKLERFSVEPAVHPDAIPALIREARVVVLPSRAEAMPLIVTEALAGARPAVSTPVSGTASIVPDPKMLVPVDDPPALAAAMGRYLRDPELAERDGRKGQEHIAATRSPEVIGAELRRIYESLGVGAG